jgi:hypothetical protein
VQGREEDEHEREPGQCYYVERRHGRRDRGKESGLIAESYEYKCIEPPR